LRFDCLRSASGIHKQTLTSLGQFFDPSSELLLSLHHSRQPVSGPPSEFVFLLIRAPSNLDVVRNHPTLTYRESSGPSSELSVRLNSALPSLGLSGKNPVSFSFRCRPYIKASSKVIRTL